ncbi:MAG: hypothetical protein FWF05_00030 [Oscillospiraceae bacterium]|nr:hypothetical protein [Oscillospiraceae bacterium]
MKKLFALLLILVFSVITCACGEQNDKELSTTDTSVHQESSVNEESSATDATNHQESSVSETEIQSIDFPTLPAGVTDISAQGKEALEKYAKYQVHGIVFSMLMDDVRFLLGNLPYSNARLTGQDGSVYDYKNITISPVSHKIPEEVGYIYVVEGKYLGFTIGESIKADADVLFGKQSNDLYGIGRYDYDPNIGKDYEGEKYMRSVFNRDGVAVGVWYEDDVVVCVSIGKSIEVS